MILVKQLKTQLLVASKNFSVENISGVPLNKDGFCRDKKSNLVLENVNFLEKAFSYLLGYLTVEKGKDILYEDYFILGQIIPAVNIPSDISKSLVLKKLR